jgi:hypothetical protein
MVDGGVEAEEEGKYDKPRAPQLELFVADVQQVTEDIFHTVTPQHREL